MAAPQPPYAKMAASLAGLQLKYTLLEKAEWWWLMDDSLAAIGKELTKNNFCVLDGFITKKMAAKVRSEIAQQHKAGRMARGVLGGGSAGKSTAYVLKEVRGDFVGWFSGSEEGHGWDAMPTYRLRVNTMVTELADHVPELKCIGSMSKVMCTCYPGGGSRYTLHIDNAGKNGRKLTALCYLNPDWTPGDGGCLRVYKPDRKTVICDIAPLAGRVLIFFSDTRVPHEVTPAAKPRFACTLWYFDNKEHAAAQEAARKAASENKAAEEEAIKREIQKFEARYGAKAAAFVTPEVAVVDADAPLPLDDVLGTADDGDGDGDGSGNGDVGQGHNSVTPPAPPPVPAAGAAEPVVGPQLPPGAEIGPQLPPEVTPAVTIGPQLPPEVTPAAPIGPHLPEAMLDLSLLAGSGSETDSDDMPALLSPSSSPQPAVAGSPPVAEVSVAVTFTSLDCLD